MAGLGNPKLYHKPPWLVLGRLAFLARGAIDWSLDCGERSGALDVDCMSCCLPERPACAQERSGVLN
eukprot:149727-Chlamydomonas_euryale.AAC.5